MISSAQASPAQIAEALAEQLAAYETRQQRKLAEPTVENNSAGIGERGRILLELAAEARDGEPVAGAKVADIGCGFGALSVFLAAHGARVVGVDPVESRLVVGRRAGKRLGMRMRLRAGTAEETGLRSSAFDLVLLNNVLCFLQTDDQRRAALRECRRLLLPGGAALIREPNRLHPIDSFTRIPLLHLLPSRKASSLATMLGIKRSRVAVLSPRRLHAALEEAGFRPIVQPPTPASSRSRALDRIARHQHAIAWNGELAA